MGNGRLSGDLAPGAAVAPAAPLVFLAACLWGCVAPDGIVGATQPLVYGADDRVELYDVGSPALAGYGRTSIVAMVWRRDLVVDAAGGVTLQGKSWQERDGLCAGQRFAEQPSVAECTGFLVGPELFMTAGHCLAAIPCAEMALVAGWAYQAEGVLAPVSQAQVSFCKKVVAAEIDEPTAARRLDYAVIQLEAPVAGAAVIALPHAPRPMTGGERLQTLGHGGGIPLKADLAGFVDDPRAQSDDYFTAALDTFHGGSGSPVFDADDQLVGLLSRGGEDLLPTVDGCGVVRTIPDHGTLADFEEVTSVFPIAEAACAGAKVQLPWCDPPAHVGGGCSIGGGRTTPGAAPVTLLLLLLALRARRSRSDRRRGAPGRACRSVRAAAPRT